MIDEEDKPLFTECQTEELSYGPSWGSIIALGLIGIALLVAILIFA
jgi:hypothetical protein